MLKCFQVPIITQPAITGLEALICSLERAAKYNPNDGVRLNIRPFMAQNLTGSKKGAGILRAKPNIHWKKDRSKESIREQAQFPWFWKNGKFNGERVNDVHLTKAEKRAARKGVG